MGNKNGPDTFLNVSTPNCVDTIKYSSKVFTKQSNMLIIKRLCTAKIRSAIITSLLIHGIIPHCLLPALYRTTTFTLLRHQSNFYVR